MKLNNIYKLKNGKIIRLIYSEFDNCFIIDLNANCYPFLIEKEKLKQIIEEKIEIKNKFKAEHELTNKEKLKYERNKSIIEFINSKLSKKELFIARKRGHVIEEASVKFSVSESTVRNLLIKFFKECMTYKALIPRYESNQKYLGGKRGCKGKIKGIKITEEVKKQIKTSLNKYYYNAKLNSLKYTFEHMLLDYYVKEIILQNDNEVPILNEEIPSYGQFYYWYKKLNDVQKEIVSRYGKGLYNQRYRSILGRTNDDTNKPFIFEIDSTIADIYLISSENKNKIIGRPVIYLLVDTYSKKVIFAYSTMENFNNYNGTLSCLYYAMTSKEKYFKQNDIDFIEDDKGYVPTRIIADRGELISSYIENAIIELNITISNTSSFRPEMKSTVERFFGFLNVRYLGVSDGVVLTDNMINERKRKDYRLEATMTLKEFNQIIWRYVNYHNNHYIFETFRDIEYDGNYTPNDIFDFGLKKYGIIKRELSEEDIYHSLLILDEATVTAQGIRFKKLFYYSKEIIKWKWFQKARANGRWKIDIKYDIQNVNIIYYHDKITSKIIEFELIDAYKEFDNLTFKEVEEIMKSKKERVEKVKKISLNHKLALYQEIENIVEKARSEVDFDERNELSKSKRLKDIRKNRKEEVKIERNESVIRDKNTHEQKEVEEVSKGKNNIKKSENKILEDFFSVQGEK